MAESGPYKYTVVIPSRNRQRYCVEAAQTVLLAEREDVQLIICDNSDDGDELPRLIKEAGIEDRLTLLPSTGSVLPMKENWERALEHFEGEWISYIGDDDGFRIDSFDILDYLTNTYITRCFGWRPLYYKWPCFPEADCGLLTVPFAETGITIGKTRPILEAHMNWIAEDKWPNAGPSIYHGLVHRSLIEITQKVYGRYFLNFVVDYSSAITNATFIENYVQYHWDVTIMGACGHSNTAGLTATGTGAPKVREFKVENPNLRTLFEGFEASKLHVPWVAAGYSELLDELGLPFGITPEKFFKSCFNELGRVREAETFGIEKERLQRFATQHGLDRTNLDAAQCLETFVPIGCAMEPLRFYFDTKGFNWTGILDVAKNLQSIKKPFSAFAHAHNEVLQKMKIAAPGHIRASAINGTLAAPQTGAIAQPQNPAVGLNAASG